MLLPKQCLTPLPPCAFVPGDINGDGEAGVLDLVIVTSFVVGFDELPEGAFCGADIDSNGTIDVTVSSKHRERIGIVDLFHCLGMLNSALTLCNTGYR